MARQAGDPGRGERWWVDAVGYEIYIRSFADSDGDGIGDLAGIIGKLDYLADLGVDFVWITPFYPSPMIDWGYDVSDHCQVDPRFGTLADVDDLLDAAHQRSIRVIVDLVPNHTSSEHPWFQAACDDSTGPYRDHYIWADPAPDGGPPNNWIGYFGGSAWTLDERSGQYHLHLFLPEQPDLNWRNPAVRDAFDDILRFWLDRGVDGFRIDMAGTLVKDAELRSNPQVAPWDPSMPILEQWSAFDHVHDVLQPENQEVFRRWRELADEHGAWLMGETYTLDPADLERLLPGDGLHNGFWFAPMHVRWSADRLRRAIDEPSRRLGDRLVWASGSHDVARAPSRFGSGDLGRARALALDVLMAFLPGVPVLYQGGELGLEDGRVDVADTLDPVGSAGDAAAGRDGCRTPMPWEPGPGQGFTTGTAWLRSSTRSDDETVERQIVDPGSWHGRYRRLLHTRRTLVDAAVGPVEWVDGGDGPVVAYRRGAVGVAVNTADTSQPFNPGVDAEVVYRSWTTVVSDTGMLDLPAAGAVVWRGRSVKEFIECGGVTTTPGRETR